MQPGGEELSTFGRLSDAEISDKLREGIRKYAPASELEGLSPDYPFRPASVLVPLLHESGQWHLLYTRRTETVQSHKGQVSFPGGAAEPGDSSPEQTALRESYEEIGLEAGDVKILGRLPEMRTVSSFLITPVVARIRWPIKFHLSTDEVSRIFTIPFVWLADTANREVRPRINRLGLQEDVIYYRPYSGEMLWGITARITVEFLKILGLISH